MPIDLRNGLPDALTSLGTRPLFAMRLSVLVTTRPLRESVAAVIVTAVTSIGTNLNTVFNNVANAI